MILVCPQCKASYLVPASVFARGARNVRCARCSYTWLADLPSKIVVMPEEMVSAFSGSNKEASSPKEQEKSQKAESPEERASGEETKAEETKAEGAKKQQDNSEAKSVKLPAIWRNPNWRRLQIAAAIAVIVAIASFFVWGVDRGVGTPILRFFNSSLQFIGLREKPVGEGLVLEQIRSERRFESGGMQLVVEGDVRNTTQEAKKVPDIQAKALGPDKSVIQSWRIEAPVVTLPPNTTAHFYSSIVAPEGAVTELNLSFIEPRNEQQ